MGDEREAMITTGGESLSIFEIMQRFRNDGSCEHVIQDALRMLADNQNTIRCAHCGSDDISDISGEYETGVVAPDGYRERCYEKGFRCAKCGRDQEYVSGIIMNHTDTNEQQGEALKPCPFCAHKVIEVAGNERDEDFRATCIGCLARSGRYRTRREAVTAWNTRSPAVGVAPGDESVAFTAYNQAIEDAKQAIRDESWTGSDAAPSFINAIARRCSPHRYVAQVAATASSPAAQPESPNTDKAIALLTKWLNEDPEVGHDELLERLLRSINENSLSDRSPAAASEGE